MDKISHSSAAENKIRLTPLIGLVQHLPSSDLEEIVAAEIRKHRSLRSDASVLYENWQAVETANSGGEGRASAAEKAYLTAMIAQQAQQTVVSTLLDVLGYIPKVPPARSH